MGLIRKTIYTGILTGVGLVGYLGATTELRCPLSRDDPLWSSNVCATYNKYRNPSTQYVVTKRIPLEKIKPELLNSDGDLALEFCRGVWSGLGYHLQRSYLARKSRGPSTKDQLWTVPQLRQSTYAPGTQVTDYFEVVEKTPTQITVRYGDSPVKNPGPRNSDGLFIISAEIDRERGEAVLGLKSCFFSSAEKVEGICGPMPAWMERAHTWYSRLWLATGAWRAMR